MTQAQTYTHKTHKPTCSPWLTSDLKEDDDSTDEHADALQQVSHHVHEGRTHTGVSLGLGLHPRLQFGPLVLNVAVAMVTVGMVTVAVAVTLALVLFGTVAVAVAVGAAEPTVTVPVTRLV